MSNETTPRSTGGNTLHRSLPTGLGGAAVGAAYAEKERPIRRTVTKAAFQAFGEEHFVNKNQPHANQNSRRGSISTIWAKLAKARYMERTQIAIRRNLSGLLPLAAINPEEVIGVPLPQFASVQETEKTIVVHARNNRWKLKEHAVAYVEPRECDDLDLDGLAGYLVAASGGLEELSSRHVPHSAAFTREVASFIPEGLSFTSLRILTDFCASELELDPQSPFAQEDLARTSAHFASLVKQ